MKKLFVYVAAGFLVVASCTEDEVGVVNEAEMIPEAATRICASMEVLEAQLQSDPKMRQRMESIESHTREVIASGRLNSRLQIEIPVVVNVIYRTTAENISAQQIQSQIAVLNEDFNRTNKDVSKVPKLFSAKVADIDVHFVLLRVNRKYSGKTGWTINDQMKSSSYGGINPTNPSEYLNIWVVNRLTSGGMTVLGYAQFPGGATGLLTES